MFTPTALHTVISKSAVLAFHAWIADCTILPELAMRTTDAIEARRLPFAVRAGAANAAISLQFAMLATRADFAVRFA
eukprot:CAMPEP_0206500002 /NCGR_PEP_ID=MMETSP0324_2-20121206/52117_1 /ASSEMBLY_ACC=CAM_ASM_000836 /TAXON_ID=2866 /ORGANISM="Crypthecodinium cohnii, Strain Seligo" /LENGTH=76 /DNA_ID=CAMNT_0053986871 /DNA_START=648 /DNA_END=874 /DNA_ORIENTATION=-